MLCGLHPSSAHHRCTDGPRVFNHNNPRVDRTIQKYVRQTRPPRPAGQTWAAFLRNHANDIWGCDFLQIHDLFFRPLFAFFITELRSQRIVHVGIIRSPSDAWVAQQLRQATPDGTHPRYLIRDNDARLGSQFATVAAGSRIKVLTTPYKAPRVNAMCERLLGGVRRECLDHVLILSEAHLRLVLKEFVTYFNRVRPHQGIVQRVPASPEVEMPSSGHASKVIAIPILGGVHHDYQRAA